MEINDQLSVEELLQAWVNLSYRYFNDKKKNNDNGEKRRPIVDRLKVKGIENIVIEGIDHESFTLTYTQQQTKRMKRIVIEK